MAALPFTCKSYHDSLVIPSQFVINISAQSNQSQILLICVNLAPTYLSILVQRNVGHLLARIKQTVLRGLAENVLECSNVHGSQKRRQTHTSQSRGEGTTEENQCKEGNSSNKQDCGRDLGCHSPSELPKDDTTEKHHTEGSNSGVRREVSHERRILVGTGELHTMQIFQTEAQQELLPTV